MDEQWKVNRTPLDWLCQTVTWIYCPSLFNVIANSSYGRNSRGYVGSLSSSLQPLRTRSSNSSRLKKHRRVGYQASFSHATPRNLVVSSFFDNKTKPVWKTALLNQYFQPRSTQQQNARSESNNLGSMDISRLNLFTLNMPAFLIAQNILQEKDERCGCNLYRKQLIQQVFHCPQFICRNAGDCVIRDSQNFSIYLGTAISSIYVPLLSSVSEISLFYYGYTSSLDSSLPNCLRFIVPVHNHTPPTVYLFPVCLICILHPHPRKGRYSSHQT